MLSLLIAGAAFRQSYVFSSYEAHAGHSVNKNVVAAETVSEAEAFRVQNAG
jgi:hypothetical protein